jgi:hypothetical protein
MREVEAAQDSICLLKGRLLEGFSESLKMAVRLAVPSTREVDAIEFDTQKQEFRQK